MARKDGAEYKKSGSANEEELLAFYASKPDLPMDFSPSNSARTRKCFFPGCRVESPAKVGMLCHQSSNTHDAATVWWDLLKFS